MVIAEARQIARERTADARRKRAEQQGARDVKREEPRARRSRWVKSEADEGGAKVDGTGVKRDRDTVSQTQQTGEKRGR